MFARNVSFHLKSNLPSDRDAASKALTAAHRVAEAKQLYSRAEVVWVYAQRAGDFELQNKAAEIQLFAKRRAGELLAEMTSQLGSRAQGRPRRDGAKVGRSNGATAYPVTLEEIGVSKDHPSKWQQVARWTSALSSENRVGAMLYRALHSSSPRPLSNHP